MKKEWNYLYAFLVFVLTMAGMTLLPVVFLIVPMVIGGVIAGDFGVDFMGYLYSTSYLNYLSVACYTTLGAPFILWFYFSFHQRERESFSKRGGRLRPVSFLWLTMLTVGLSYFTNLIFTGITWISPAFVENYDSLVESSGITEYSLMWLFSTLILPPIVEETIFRGLILKYLQRAGAAFLVANLIQAVCFGIYHGNIVQGIYTFVIGLFFGYVAWRYDSLIPGMFMHFVYNLIGTVGVELQSMFLPDILYVLFILGSVPTVVLAMVLIHYRVGETRKEEFIR